MIYSTSTSGIPLATFGDNVNADREASLWDCVASLWDWEPSPTLAHARSAGEHPVGTVSSPKNTSTTPA
jgi:hypothetical protein